MKIKSLILKASNVKYWKIKPYERGYLKLIWTIMGNEEPEKQIGKATLKR